MKEVKEYNVNKTTEYKIILNANENTRLLDEGEIVDILLSLKDTEINRYPETTSKELRKAYGNIIGISEENILAGNGSDQLLGVIISSYVNKGKTVLTLKPDFSMYDFYASINEGNLVKLSTKKDGSFFMDSLIELAKEVKPSVIVFSNPNNPTGHAVPAKEIERLLGELKDSKVVIDEAYIEFGGETMIPYIKHYDNLIVTRTLSKAWGLAALRVGFLITSKKNINDLKPFMVPYNLNAFSQQFARKILEYEDIIGEAVENIIEERERFYGHLKEIEKRSNKKIRFYKSNANFIFGRSIYAKQIKNKFDDLGILIRYFKDSSFRITVGSHEELQEVIKGLTEVLEERGSCYGQESTN